MVEGYRRQCPRSYTAVGKHISSLNEEVSALLGGLSGSGFRKTIAEVVTRDFGEMVRKVREEVTQANSAYRQELASIELDRSKVARVQEALQHLYSWRREEPTVKVSDERNREEFLKSSRRSSKRKIF
jgi:Sec-independent protein translocase protein TatA